MSDDTPPPLSEDVTPSPPPVEPVAPLALPPPLPPEVVKGKVSKTRHVAHKIEKLTCWPEVLTLLENGEPVSKIAAYIQDQRKEYLEAGRDAVESALYYWLRKDKSTIGDRAPTAHVPLITSSSGQVDPLEASNLILAMALDRLNESYVREKKSGKSSHSTSEAMRLALDATKQKAEIETKRRRYAPPPPSTAKGPNDVMNQIEQLRRIYEQRYGEAAARVILNDESRGRVINALKRVRGGGEALSRIIDQNVDKADDLNRKAEQRAADEVGAAIVVDMVEET